MASADTASTEKIKVKTGRLEVSDTEGNPIFIVDGKETDRQTLERLNGRIASVTVLKGKNATDLYGDKAANGAMLITTLSGEPANDVEVHVGNGKPQTIINSDEADSQPRSDAEVSDTADPLLIIDGKESTMAELNNLKTDNISSVSVIKDRKKAIGLYGDKAADGVVVVETKK